MPQSVQNQKTETELENGSSSALEPASKAQSSSHDHDAPATEREGKGAPDSTNSAPESMQSLKARLDYVERKLQEQGIVSDNEDVSKPKPPIDEPILVIPELRYVEWIEFKNKQVGEKQASAIEVLVGKAKYWYQREASGGKPQGGYAEHKSIQTDTVEENGHGHEGDSEGFKELPERIRINSHSVIAILSKIDSQGSWPRAPMVVLRPYKPFVYYEKPIRETLRRLETDWAEAETPDGATLDIRSDEVDKVKDLTDGLQALRDLRCLVQFMDQELKPVVDRYSSDSCKKVAFSELWYLFKPGDLIYSPLGTASNNEVAVRDGNRRKPNDRFQYLWRIERVSDGRINLMPRRNIRRRRYSYSSSSNSDYDSDSDSRTDEKLDHSQNPFKAIAYYCDFDGVSFGTLNYYFYIRPFDGYQDITSLVFYPLRYTSKATEVVTKATERGLAWEEFLTFKHKNYAGRSLFTHPSGHRDSDFPRHAEAIDSPVVVDFNEALAAEPEWKPDLINFNITDIQEPDTVFTEKYRTKFWKDPDHQNLERSEVDRIYIDRHIDMMMSNDQGRTDIVLKRRDEFSIIEYQDLSDTYRLLLPNRVFAFVLRNRKFAILTVDGLRPTKRYSRGWDDLIIPKAHKLMVRSLVVNHFANKAAEQKDPDASHSSDLVSEKGKGLVILLHGAPGVGKTSTAECVAEFYGKLLFPITCGDLGLTASRVEEELSDKFHLAEKWNCVLLLDEADVFLAQRTRTDVKRNSLVSVFLRVLEYFSGILFLTTNRVGAFDEAFKSRVHMQLYYAPLGWKQTKCIWETNMKRLKEKKDRRKEKMIIDERAIFAYAQEHYNETYRHKANWNGRQIRNAFQTATAMAEYDALVKTNNRKDDMKKNGQPLTDLVPTEPVLEIDHFKTISKATWQFDDYIRQTKGFTDDHLAYLNEERHDNIRVTPGPPGRNDRTANRVPLSGRGSHKPSSQKPPPSFRGRASNYEEEDPPFEDNYQDFDDEPREETFDYGPVHQLSTPRKTSNFNGRAQAKNPLGHLRSRPSPLRSQYAQNDFTMEEGSAYDDGLDGDDYDEEF